MKSLVLSAIICATTAGVSLAGNGELPNDQKKTATFKSEIAFHQRNVDMLWNQYGLAEARIKQSHGNHAELDRDRAFFIGVYQKDIDNGIRIAQSKKAITEIEELYAKKRAQRDAYEKTKLARLQEQLRTELKREQKSFEKTCKKNAHLINNETLPLLREAEHYLANAIDRANHFNDSKATIAAR